MQSLPQVLCNRPCWSYWLKLASLATVLLALVADAGAQDPPRLFCSNEAGPLRCGPLLAGKLDVLPHDLSKGSDAEEQTRPAALLAAWGAESSPHEVLAAVRVNGNAVMEFATVLQKDKDFCLPQELLAAARLRIPGPPLLFRGQTYTCLAGNDGINYDFDPAQQILSLIVAPGLFGETVIDPHQRTPASIDVPSPGLFLNHDFQVTGWGGGPTIVGGLLEAGMFSRLGVLTSRFSGSDLAHDLPFRVDTQLTRDFPARRATLVIGDSVSGGAPWARQVYFAGVKFASKFSSDTSFLPMVLPALHGEVAQPSAFDLYIDNVRTLHSDLPAGPFAIQNIPVVTAQGQLRMVVTDAAGRQQIIAAPYLYSRNVLRRGVDEYSYEAGVLRYGFATRHSSYRSSFFSGTHRHGLSDALTLNLRAEFTGRNQSGSVGLDYAWRGLGVFSAGVAGSNGAGTLGYLQAQHVERAFSLSAGLQVAGAAFKQLGLVEGEIVPKLIGQVNLGFALGRRGSFTVGYMQQRNRASLLLPVKPDVNVATASLGLRVAGNVYLNIAGNYSPSWKDARSLSVSLVLPLGSRRVAVSNTTIQPNSTEATLDFRQQLPMGDGYGYRVRTGLADNRRIEAGVSMQTARGLMELEAGRNSQRTEWRVREASSIIWLNRRVLASRWLNESFAVVDTSGTGGIPVYANNQYIARTRRSGLAVVPFLAAYDRNLIALDDAGVPLSVSLDMNDRTVVPMSRTGVLVKFASRPAVGALIVLVDSSGEPLPLGATVVRPGETAGAVIAFRGEVFLPEISFPATLRVEWPEHRCLALVPAPPGRELLPRIGPVVCKEE